MNSKAEGGKHVENVLKFAFAGLPTYLVKFHKPTDIRSKSLSFKKLSVKNIVYDEFRN
jgi:hypothetical protein